VYDVAVICVIVECNYEAVDDQHCFEHMMEHRLKRIDQELHNLSGKINRMLGLELTELKKENQILANEQALADAVSTIDTEIQKAIDILTHLPTQTDPAAQTAIDNAIAVLSGDAAPLQAALDAANPATPGGVNDTPPA